MIDSAMRADLAKDTTRRIVLYSEPLDAQRFAVEPREPELVGMLAKKYEALHIDVVVAVTQPALEFFKRHGLYVHWPLVDFLKQYKWTLIRNESRMQQCLETQSTADIAAA